MLFGLLTAGENLCEMGLLGTIVQLQLEFLYWQLLIINIISTRRTVRGIHVHQRKHFLSA